MRETVQQIELRNFSVEMFDESIANYRRIVSDVSLRLRAGQGLGITGESGSGKTSLSLALSGLLPRTSRVSADAFELRFGPDGRVEQVAGGSSRRLARTLSDLHGRETFTLFQEPRASLNPYRTIGWQLSRCASRGRKNAQRKSFGSVRPTLTAALASVGLDADTLRHYPHELSTGMCQRVFLAMASLLGSTILVADEPFASVDPDTQTKLAELVRSWMQRQGMILILVSHDLELLRQLTDYTVVLFRGQVAESGRTNDVLGDKLARHPYTKLLEELSGNSRSVRPGRSSDPGREFADPSPAHPPRDFQSRQAPCCFAPRCGWADETICRDPIPSLRPVSASDPTAGEEEDSQHRLRCVRYPLREESSGRLLPSASMSMAPPAQESVVLRVNGVSKEFRFGWFHRHAKTVIERVELTLREGERVGIVGPSGHGKTTLARIILGAVTPSSGTVELYARGSWRRVSSRRPDDAWAIRRSLQMVYQDTDLVLDPASRVSDALIEAYQVFDPRLSKSDCYRLGNHLLSELGLAASSMEAYPYRLSGGERKRIAIARCLAALGCPFEPRPESPWRVLVLDEPTAGVDVVLQSIMARFLEWAQRRLRLSYLVISHDEGFVRHFSHRILRLQNGQLFPDTPVG